jgi:hypothetical protein
MRRTRRRALKGRAAPTRGPKGSGGARVRPARDAARAVKSGLGVRPEVGDDHRAPPVSETQRGGGAGRLLGRWWAAGCGLRES